MKVKIEKNKKTSETKIGYFKVAEKSTFRFNLLKKYLNTIECDITLIIDTNQLTQYISKEDIEEILNNAGVAFTAFSIKKDSSKLAGINIDSLKVQGGTLMQEVLLSD